MGNYLFLEVIKYKIIELGNVILLLCINNKVREKEKAHQIVFENSNNWREAAKN